MNADDNDDGGGDNNDYDDRNNNKKNYEKQPESTQAKLVLCSIVGAGAPNRKEEEGK